MSSYLALRYIEDENSDFYPGHHHVNIKPLPKEQRIPVKTPSDIDTAIRQQLENFRDLKKGVLLSGGMDSAIAASYLRGSDAYTFRFLGGDFQREELSRAEYYAERYGLNFHYVDISWDTVTSFLAPVMKAKAAPVHSIEPQIYQAALQAQNDGVEIMFSGATSDLIFGGMDQLLSQDWTLDGFMKRYTFTNPSDVINEPVSMRHVFERYRTDGEMIDFLSFMADISLTELMTSYVTTFSAAGMKYYDPYAKLIMAEPLDLQRVRNGESKYLIRALFSMKYPGVPVPEKNPMPRPVDEYFREWPGPSRSEFRRDIDISKFTGNQKWQMYCLEKFLDMNEPKA